MQAKQWDAAIDAFNKANEMDPKQNVIWAQLAEAYVQSSATKTGAEQQAAMTKGLEAFAKALELKPDDAAYHNNYALSLAKDKKFPEAQAELARNSIRLAGKCFYNSVRCWEHRSKRAGRTGLLSVS